MSLENKLDRPVYTFQEAVKESKKYFGGDELTATVFVNKYALKDSAGNIYENSPDQMHRRLAKEIARIEMKYKNPLSEEKIYSVIKGFKHIIPQGGPMTGIGNDYQIASLSNCFVIGNEGPSDSYGGIMKIDEEQVQLMKRRGGVGHDLSHIRPVRSSVQNSALTSTGVVPFMERYSNSTREVAQDGRRGALMLSLSIKHPDAEAFIDAKMEKGKVTGANVSVKLTDDFMEAVKNDGTFIQQYPVDSPNPTFKKEVKAKTLWDKIVHNAWKSAEPGILFWDTVQRESVPDVYAEEGYKTVSTNPCGEIPLCPYDSCRLLALNLFGYVEKPFTKEAKFNYEKFKAHVSIAQRIMDDIVDLEKEKIQGIKKKIKSDPETDQVKRTELELWEKIEDKNDEGRRTGIGITAEGDMLAALGLTYGTDNANDFSEEVHQTLAIETYRSSTKLAIDRGAMIMYSAEREKGNPFIERLREADPEMVAEMEKHGRRNVALLTIAPTGTTSLMAQTTSGIEPVFLPAYVRRRKVNPNDKDVKVAFVDEVGDSWEEYNVFHHKFKYWLETNGHDFEKVKEYSEQELNDLVKKSPYYKATSNDVNWVKKVEMQGKIQKWVDHSISVTVNLPKDISEEKVGEVYMKAWEVGCKGVTVYRDGSREGVLLTGKEKEGNFPKKRPKSLEAELFRFKNVNEDGEMEDWISFVGLIKNKPYEIFTGKMDEEVLAVHKSIKKGKIVKETNGKTHYDFHFTTKRGYNSVVGGISDQFKKEYWNYNRFISGDLRHQIPIEDIIDTVDKLDETDGINSWKAGVIRTLKKYIENGTKSKEKCSQCDDGGELIYQEGCLICSCCGESKCG
ncbi:adenosylcobalamin-dependent ribonucleoside-diphosphate reductase [archaeon]|jgi:ribonucleoside-diphosphate reductase alpha chain|nr:adenosylcobalamin-dependent ribonucleoside-diphosphate reductase [archaeon]